MRKNLCLRWNGELVLVARIMGMKIHGNTVEREIGTLGEEIGTSGKAIGNSEKENGTVHFNGRFK